VKIYRLAIPIPFENDVENIAPYIEPYKMTDGPERIDNKYTKKQVKNIEQQFPNAKPIGFGGMGIAYDIGDNKILKVTIDETELDSATRLMEKPLDTHANVYQVNEQNGYIILEKLTPLTRSEKQIYTLLHRTRFWQNKQNKIVTNREQLIEYIKSINYEHEFSNTQETFNLMDKIIQFVSKLIKNGLTPHLLDIHKDNVGFDNNGNMKILDLGMSL
jgi:hypothetical protein